MISPLPPLSLPLSLSLSPLSLPLTLISKMNEKGYTATNIMFCQKCIVRTTIQSWIFAINCVDNYLRIKLIFLKYQTHTHARTHAHHTTHTLSHTLTPHHTTPHTRSLTHSHTH